MPALMFIRIYLDLLNKDHGRTLGLITTIPLLCYPISIWHIGVQSTKKLHVTREAMPPVNTSYR